MNVQTVDTVSVYKESLKTSIQKFGLDQSNWKTEDFVHRTSLGIFQEVLKDADDRKGALISLLTPFVGEVLSRPTKSADRVMTKISEEEKNAEAGKPWTNFLRPLVDFQAYRIHCPASSIENNISHIKRICTENGYVVFVKGASQNNEKGGYWDAKENRLRDIIQYVYVYSEKIGHIAEIQVGEKFATHTFALDSEKRNAEDRNEKWNGVDLWDNNFYNDVKNVILGRDNQSLGNDKLAKKNDLIKKAREMHGESHPTRLQELLNILDEI